MDAQGLFTELKRRRVIRAVVGYGIGAFAVLQIVEPIVHGLHWPDAVLSYVVAGLAVGFPVVVSLAWIFDVNAGRIERTERKGPLSHLSGRQLALVLIGIGALAAAPGTIWYFLVRGIAKPPASSAPAAERTAPSIAVLPFVNLSSDKEQEYFSDGIAEEILNALAQIDGLHVAGRTSSFYFKGKNEDLVSIAEKLHVATLLEGSVRKSGDRVRITAQLINARDGYHLWSKQYDRELTDIFKVQGELAAAVVEALKVKLLPGTDVAAKVKAAHDPEAYRLVLLGRSLIFQQTQDSARRAEAVLEKAVALEPTYAPGWYWLAVVRGNVVLSAPRGEVESRGRASLEAIERAIAADLANPIGYSARGWIRSNVFWDWAGAESDLQHALSVNAADPLKLVAYSTLLQKLGRLKEAIAAQRKFIESEPLDSISSTNLGSYLTEDGQLEAARDAFLRAREISPENLYSAKGLALVDLLEGHPAPALAAFERLSIEADRLQGIAAAQHDLGHTAESQKALDALTAKADGPEADIAYRIATVHAWRGDKDRAFAWLDRAFARRDLQLRFLKVDPLLRSLRADPRYRALLEKMKLPLD